MPTEPRNALDHYLGQLAAKIARDKARRFYERNPAFARRMVKDYVGQKQGPTNVQRLNPVCLLCPYLSWADILALDEKIRELQAEVQAQPEANSTTNVNQWAREFPYRQQINIFTSAWSAWMAAHEGEISRMLPGVVDEFERQRAQHNINRAHFAVVFGKAPETGKAEEPASIGELLKAGKDEVKDTLQPLLIAAGVVAGVLVLRELRR